MTVFFTSDLHLNHVGILTLGAGRPFATVNEMNESIIERWNSIVTDKDTVHVLGDFGFNTKRHGTSLEEIFARLRGYKHLTIGNHDEKNPRVLALPWKSIDKMRTVRYNGMRAECSHYPYETWKGASRALMLHGHSHNNLKRIIPHRFDVGIDAFPAGPVSFEHLWEISKTQTFEPADHHGEQ